MKVVLNQDVKSLGKKGELVNVSDGYARNFLFPKNLAVPADAQNLSELKNRESSKQFKIDTEKAEAQKAADTLSGKTVKISAKAGANGRLFGAVTSKEIAEHIRSQFSVNVDKRKISVEDIKNYGTYSIEVKLYQGITTNLFVTVGE